jgi:hypothetical protein
MVNQHLAGIRGMFDWLVSKGRAVQSGACRRASTFCQQGINVGTLIRGSQRGGSGENWVLMRAPTKATTEVKDG